MPSLQPYGGPGWALSCLLPPSAISLFASVLVKHEAVQQASQPPSQPPSSDSKRQLPARVPCCFEPATMCSCLSASVRLCCLPGRLLCRA
jgi:hypothetical protein